MLKPNGSRRRRAGLVGVLVVCALAAAALSVVPAVLGTGRPNPIQSLSQLEGQGFWASHVSHRGTAADARADRLRLARCARPAWRAAHRARCPAVRAYRGTALGSPAGPGAARARGAGAGGPRRVDHGRVGVEGHDPLPGHPRLPARHGQGAPVRLSPLGQDGRHQLRPGLPVGPGERPAGPGPGAAGPAHQPGHRQALQPLVRRPDLPGRRAAPGRRRQPRLRRLGHELQGPADAPHLRPVERDLDPGSPTCGAAAGTRPWCACPTVGC